MAQIVIPQAFLQTLLLLAGGGVVVVTTLTTGWKVVLHKVLDARAKATHGTIDDGTFSILSWAGSLILAQFYIWFMLAAFVPSFHATLQYAALTILTGIAIGLQANGVYNAVTLLKNLTTGSLAGYSVVQGLPAARPLAPMSPPENGASAAAAESGSIPAPVPVSKS